MISCPYCAEQIQDAAIKCRWCGSDLVPPATAAPTAPATAPPTAPVTGPPWSAVSAPPAAPVTGPPWNAAPPPPVGAVRSCHRCGAGIAGSDAFCRTCGSPVVAQHAAAPPTGQFGPQPVSALANRPVEMMGSLLDSVSSPVALARWWRAPLLAAASAFGGALAICMVIYGTIYALIAADRTAGAPIPNPIQMVLLLFFQFHRVALGVDIPEVDTSGATFVFAPLGGTLLIGIVLALAGAFVGARESTVGGRVLAVLRYAAAYAVLSFVASFLVAADLGGAEGVSGRTEASHVGALFMSLLWAMLFGSVGMVTRVYGRRWVRPLGAALERRARGAGGAFVGAISGLRTGLGLALLGVVLIVVLNIVVNVVSAPPTPAGSVPAEAGPSDQEVRFVLLALLSTLLLLPNLAIAALLAGMGATLNATGSTLVGSVSGSVGIFGASGTGTGAIDVPEYLLLLLLVPAIATVRAGFVAARETAQASGPAMRAALGAGALMAVGCWLLAWISGGAASTPAATASIAISPAAALFLPPIWCLVGAWLGALLFVARQQRATAVSGYGVPVEQYADPSGQFAASTMTFPPSSAPPAPYIAPTAPTSPTAPVSPFAPPGPYPPAAAYTPPAQYSPPAPAAGTRPCGSCGTVNDPENNFCEACGQHLSPAA